MVYGKHIPQSEFLGGRLVVWMQIGMVALLVAVIGSPVTVRFLWELQGAKGHISLEIRYLFWLTYRRRIAIEPSAHSKEPLLHSASSSSTEATDHVHAGAGMIGDLFHKVLQIRNLWPAVERLLHKITVREYAWRTDIGLLDAVDTALLCGGAWIAMSGLTGLFTQLFTFAELPTLGVSPTFHRTAFSTRLSCIATLRLGKAIYAGLGLLWLLRRGAARGRTSDSVADADSNGKYQGNGGREHDYRGSGGNA